MAYLATTLSDEEYEALEKLARERGISVPEILRRAIILYLRLESYREQEPMTSIRRLASQ